MGTYPQFVTVYRVLDLRKLECNLRHEHEIPVYAEKHLRLIAEVRINPNSGGQKSYSDTSLENPVYVDTQGRRYNSYVSVDYYSSVSYKDSDGVFWMSGKPRDGIRVDKFEEMVAS
jgi:hypothetical protein